MTDPTTWRPVPPPESPRHAAGAGERLVAGIAGPPRFHDHNKRRAYALARFVAARLVDNPGLVAAGLDYVARHMDPDPRQRPYAAAWRGLLALDTSEIARRLLADTPEGDLLRDTMPVLYVPTDAERAAIFAQAHREPGP